ncbi:replication initiation protein [Capnocytophaga canimorsus]|uniref:replication initiation protein n=1 Tax=Capnocytophaga canimorsus TaxID=28188 RepID=UPI0037D90E5B
MAVIKNKEVLQSYIITTARYDFSVYEKRILYRIVEVLQSKLSGLKLTYNYSIQKDLYGDFEFTLPISIFLKDGNDTNYNEVKKALKSLRNKDFEYEDATEWGVYGIIEKPKIKKYESVVKLIITPLLMEAFMNFAKGYRKYELKTAMEFDSVYTMRFYELLSGQERPLSYTIEDLKKMFKIEDKYKQINDFIKRVVEPAKNELFEKAPYSFEYKMHKIGRKFHSITFHPFKIPANRDLDLERHELEKQLSPRWILKPQTLKYLQEEFSFSHKEIAQWYDLFREAQKTLDLLNFLAEKKRYATEAKNPKGYVINCIKNELKAHFKKNQLAEIQQELNFDFLEPDENLPDLSPEEAKSIVNEIFK